MRVRVTACPGRERSGGSSSDEKSQRSAGALFSLDETAPIGMKDRDQVLRFTKAPD
jgi:hypothetical protein